MSEPDSPNSPAQGRAALRRLADCVRQLIDATVTVQAPLEVLDSAVTAIDRVTADLRPFVPDPPPPRYLTGGATESPSDLFPYDCVLGAANPLAVPIRVAWIDPKAVGTVRFGTPYEGPPGCVHGAVIAAAFDQMFAVANLMAGTPGPTRRLELRYERPTPLFEEVCFEAWRERVDENRVYTAGRLLVDDVVTVEAEGLFIMLSPERVMQMLKNHKA
ncbi:MAG: hypothetical protein A3J75_05745 [Acidobacteria bacterium RBG_16_68_9]|nr:MAG: hypothetical protein A3J75_05745 [Acidobacteria bacterium RBG_16_68_9]